MAKIIRRLPVLFFLLLLGSCLFFLLPKGYSEFDFYKMRISGTNSSSRISRPRMSDRKGGSNLPPIPYLEAGKNKAHNKTCAQFATFENILFSNSFWQYQKIGGLEFYLFNAYMDTRPRPKESSHFVVISVMAQVDSGMQEICSESFCQLWSENATQPIISKVVECRRLWVDGWGGKSRYIGRLVSCRLPESQKELVPSSVSLVGEPCSKATNHLKIYYDKPSHQDNSSLMDSETPETKAEDDSTGKIAVCVKGLDFLEESKTSKLIEWIETYKLLGVDKIFLYEFATHPNVKKVLDYYEVQGFVDVVPLSLPGVLPNEPSLRHFFVTQGKNLIEKRRNEVLAYNDCVYRNMYNYEYVAVIDTDEVLIPVDEISLKQLLKSVKGGTDKSSYCFRQSHHYIDIIPEHDVEEHGIPSSNFMLQHIYRQTNFTRPGVAVKCIHRMDSVAAMHNHFPFSCLKGCTRHSFDPSIEARMQHFKGKNVFAEVLKKSEGCKGVDEMTCRGIHLTQDRSLWRFKDELIQRVEKVLTEIG